MNTKLFLSAVLIHLYIAAIGQIEGKQVFYDDFLDLEQGWSSGSRDEVNVGIQDGHYYMEHKRTFDGWQSHLPLGEYFNPLGNWSIETKIRQVSGVDNYGYGIIFGRKENGYQSEFLIAQTGYYSIYYSNGSYTTYLNNRTDDSNWTPTNTVVQGDYQYNTIKVEKVGKKWNFYINDKLVTTSKAYPWAGKRFGYIVYNQQRVEIDYISVKQVLNGYTPSSDTQPGDNLPPSLTLYEPQLHRGLESVSSKELRVAGLATDSEGIATVIVNGKPADIMHNGYFSVVVPLELGRNTINVVVTDMSGKTTERSFPMQSSGDTPK